MEEKKEMSNWNIEKKKRVPGIKSIQASTADVTNRYYQGGFPKIVQRESVGGGGIR